MNSWAREWATRFARIVGGLILAGLLTGLSYAQNNVLVLVADDLGADSIRAFGVGSAPPPTPNIDGLANRGVRFRHFWTNAVCSPTRACIQTGRYSFRTFVGQAIPFGPSGVLPLEEYTIPEVLDAAGSGYAHAAIGKWHLGDATVGGDLAPNLAGWSHFAGIVSGGVHDYFDWQRTVDGVTNTSTEYATSKIVDDAVAWIAQQSGPWVCFVSFNAPHSPFHAPPAALHSQDLTGKDPRTEPIPFYKAMVEAMDMEIGRLLGSLGAELATTNVLFLSDNGTDSAVIEPPFDPSKGKSTPYELGISVPLIVCGPDVVGPSRQVDHPIAAVDLFGTILELTGTDATSIVPPWLPLDSQPVVPYLQQPGRPSIRQFTFAEQFSSKDFTAVGTTGFATIRDFRYKLIRFYGGGSVQDELYDLWFDPRELFNLARLVLTQEQTRAKQALSDELNRLRSPAGVLSSFGSPTCVGSAGIPTSGGTGTPTIGQAYTVTLGGAPPTTAAAMVLGLSTDAWDAVPLPLPLSLIGSAPGCDLVVSPDAALPLFTDRIGAATFVIPLPRSLELVGQRVYHTWLVADPLAPANPLGVTAANGTAVLIGL
ncbi:MAG: sulfatase-like hydrolase/transferase [Planctomycetota bacterium]